METIRMAFYKPTKGDFWGQLIAGWTGLFNLGQPRYDHVEIGFFIDKKLEWYSSASRNEDGKSGTRWIAEEKLFKHPERWDVVDLKALRPISEMIKTCEEELGKPYDWYGIFGFITPFGKINAKDKWYCSEICNYVFFGRWQKRVSPTRLFSKIKKHII